MEERTEGIRLTQLQGQLERVTYTNEENGYTIARVKVRGRRELVTVVGNIVDPTPGEILRMSGEWTSHPKYGEQFKVVSYSCAVPASVHGIEKYLGSGLIKGIGPVMARRIAGVFGVKTLDVIEEDADRLTEVSGIGPQRVAMIRRAWEEQKEIREVMLFLQSHGVSSAYATRIYRQYAADALRVVRENPYRLAHDIFGIGFVTADGIAAKLGFEPDSPQRAEAGILYVLHQLTDEGHVCYPRGALLEKAREILQVEPSILADALGRLEADRRITAETARESDEVDVYLSGYHTAEVQTARRLTALRDGVKSIRAVRADKALVWVQDKLGFTLAVRQREAVRAALDSKVLVITGGPGTGKTTIIKAILRIFEAVTPDILLAAPTGRAAKRLSETTGREAKTLHRLLETDMRRGGFQKNENDPLRCDLLVVDEASMVDVLLMHHLLKAVPEGATLLLVGDVDQLPSVGAGSVLQDIIRSRTVPVVELNEIFRQARESSIIVNAHRIIGGTLPQLRSGPDEDFFFAQADDPEKAAALIIRLVKERIPARFGLDPVDDVQVLTPMNRGVVGTSRLNEALQEALNPNGFALARGGRTFRVGDKVMQIRNNYDKNVFNGDMGRITAIDPEAQEVRVEVDGLEVVYDYTELDELVLSYAVSIHKSQGSEYPAVVLPILPQHYVMLQRNLLYTGVTRGRKLVVLVGSRKALHMAVRNNKILARHTRLRERLAGGKTP